MKLVLVGRVAGSFGVRGEVKITAFGEDPKALVRYATLLRKDGAAALTLASGREHKGQLIARAREVATKEQADALRGLDLYVPRDALPPPEEEEFYLTDLIGLSVVTPDGAPLGRIKAVPNYGAGDLLEIERRPGPALLVPFTRAVVPEVDIAAGRVVVDPPMDAPDDGAQTEAAIEDEADEQP